MSEQSVLEEDLKFKLPFGMIIAGPSSSGKTTFMLKFLEFYKELITPIPKEILYCYGEYHNFIPKMEQDGIRTYNGVPSEEMIRNAKKPMLLILDDLMAHISEKFLTDLFTKKSHHMNFGVIYITQNLFEKNVRCARNNAMYICLTRSPNAILSIRNIGTQLFPKQLNYFLSSYEEATKNLYGYLLLDLHAGSNPILKLRTNIFPTDSEKIIFANKNG